jgi:hypothetical protein
MDEIIAKRSSQHVASVGGEQPLCRISGVESEMLAGQVGMRVGRWKYLGERVGWPISTQ